MNKSQYTYAFSYGFLGGPLNSYRFRRLLNAEGFSPAKSLEKADIIIAHSAGCFLIPSLASPKLVIFIGMPLIQNNLRKTLRTAQRENARAFIRNHTILLGILIGIYSFYYGLTQPKRNLDIMHNAKKTPRIFNFSGSKTLLIVNKNDPWTDLEKTNINIYDYKWTFIGLDGTHDNIWEHPGRYVDVIRSFLK